MARKKKHNNHGNEWVQRGWRQKSAEQLALRANFLRRCAKNYSVECGTIKFFHHSLSSSTFPPDFSFPTSLRYLVSLFFSTTLLPRRSLIFSRPPLNEGTTRQGRFLAITSHHTFRPRPVPLFAPALFSNRFSNPTKERQQFSSRFFASTLR